MIVQLQAVGGTPPYTWSASPNPLNGFNLSSSGLITGSPTTSFTTTWNITVTDSTSATALFGIPVTIAPKRIPVPIISPIYKNVFDLIDSTFSSPFIGVIPGYILDSTRQLNTGWIQARTIDNTIHSVNITGGGGGS